jgi:pyridoxine 5-phosphate synthase
MIQLGVNIDHIATLRNARGGVEPSVLFAAGLAAQGGADSITIHLREDRRHITDADVHALNNETSLPLNLEMSCADEIVEIALGISPEQITLVPERREEKTTESGLDVIRHLKNINHITEQFREKGCRSALFVDPDLNQLRACLKTASRTVELHTGAFANASGLERKKELKRIEDAALWCSDHGFTLHAGHGLNYHNTYDILHLPSLRELNIGHSIISRSVFTGLEQAVVDMKNLIQQGNTQFFSAKTQTLLESHNASQNH